jgi:hypothetical protein
MSKADDREFIGIMKKVGGVVITPVVGAVVGYFIKKNKDKKRKDK